MKKSEVIPIGLMLWLCMYGAAWPQDTNTTTEPIIPTQGTANTPIQIQQGSRPVPDPTTLTAEAIKELRRELTTLYEQIFRDLQRQIDRNQLRLDLQQQAMTNSIETSERLTAEKFKGLSDQQVQRDNNLALALTAQQKSVADQNLSNLTAADKAEKNFKEQIAGIQSLLAQQEKTSGDKINDLKDRITQIESSKSGAGGAVNWVIAGIGVFATLIGIGTALFALMKPTPVPLPVVQYSETNGNGNGRRRS